MQASILGRPLIVVNARAPEYAVAYQIVGPRTTYDLVHIGGGWLQPRNRNGAFCAIAGNYFFWVAADGTMSCGTRDQRMWQRSQERKAAAAQIVS